VPETHAVQAEANDVPVTAENVPAEQAVQAARPADAAKVPAAQATHLIDPTIDVVPAGQRRHALADVAPSISEKLPAKHPTHTPAPLEKE
jgi:hypothetical protein